MELYCPNDAGFLELKLGGKEGGWQNSIMKLWMGGAMALGQAPFEGMVHSGNVVACTKWCALGVSWWCMRSVSAVCQTYKRHMGCDF
eukprot:scaffold1271_cov18-Tisochrysis_lutea.AAC.1